MNLPSFSERKLQFIQVISQMTDPEEFSQLEALSQKYHKKDESFFWEMIDLLDWEQSDNELIIKPLIQVLSQKSLSEIFTFQEYLSQKLFFLDQKRFAQNFADQYFSVDTFLYVRACVVANGKAFYDHICQNPQEMPSDLTFESLLYVAQKAYQQQTGQHFMPYLPTVSYETYSNKIAWL
ncbi:MAG: DUF4240 domain-containing protein [Bacteroidetes bacterium]|nr:MAG: DUF4240 domain-containing protein [Bacteroidota bacterium]